MKNNIQVENYTYEKYLNGEAPIVDAHCHLSLMDNPSRDFECWSFGLLPMKYDGTEALGYHPWMVFSDSVDEQLQIFKSHVSESQMIGEIGLDFSPKHETTKDVQIKAFTEICNLLENKIVSIHAVHATKEVLDILEATGAGKRNTIIMHWFTGSSDNLNRAIAAGYYFSCCPRMAQTRKGEEYIRQIPQDKLLVETDLPWEDKDITNEEHYNLVNDFLIYLREYLSDTAFNA